MTYTSNFTGQQINGAIAMSVHDVVMPPKLYAVTGTQFQINLSNATNRIYADANWLLSGAGAHMDGVLVDTTPDVADDGATLTFSQYSLNGDLLDETTAEYVVTASTQAGSRSVMVVGDSTVAGNDIVDAVEAKVAADGVLDITWIGTQGVTNLHEGRAGWTISQFYSDESSPFYDAGGFADGYAAYCVANGTPDVVIIKLGINDFWSHSTDSLASADISVELPKLLAMIDGIHDKNPHTHIGIDFVGGPSSQDNIGSDYGAYSAWRVRRNFQMFNQALLSADIGDNVYLLHGNLAISLANYTNGLHPDSTGYGEIADCWYAWIKHIATNDEAFQYLGWHDGTYNNATRTDTQTYGSKDGTTLTTTYVGAAFNGVGMRFSASPGQMRIVAKITCLIDGVNDIYVGIKLWNGNSAVDYNIPSESEGIFGNYIGYYNYDIVRSAADAGDINQIDTTIDLSSAPTFDSISIHVVGYDGEMLGGNSLVEIDMTRTYVTSA